MTIITFSHVASSYNESMIKCMYLYSNYENVYIKISNVCDDK